MLATCHGNEKTNLRSNGFPQRLASLRKERSLTQQALAEMVGLGITQMKRYEAGSSQPTLDVIRKLSQVLRVSADELLFGKAERGPDEDLRLQFEAISRFNDDEKKVVRSVLEGLLLTHEARRWPPAWPLRRTHDEPTRTRAPTD